jgi:HEAT repeat protein
MGLAKARPRAGDDLTRCSGESADDHLGLDHPDPAARRRAAHALAAEPGHETTLCRHLALETNPSVRETILLALIRLGTAEAASELAGLLASEDASLRNSALESLTAMPAEAARLLDRLGGAGDPDVRIFGVILASALPFAWIGGWLADRLLHEDNANVCAALAEALAEAGDHRAVRALEAMPARFPNEPFLRFVAEMALRRLTREA